MILKNIKKIFKKKPAVKKVKKEVKQKIKEEEVLVLSEDKTYENEVMKKATKETKQETKSSLTFGV
jgi:3-deoxy-D-manno-octulosonic-acid transferase|tara:strand:+ start:203 stop:400 length:198 start_codon:yes stop_codon:yes gene_type:complete